MGIQFRRHCECSKFPRNPHSHRKHGAISTLHSCAGSPFIGEHLLVLSSSGTLTVAQIRNQQNRIKMDFLSSATLLKADGSSVDSATALQGKVQRIVFYVLHFIHLDNINKEKTRIPAQDGIQRCPSSTLLPELPKKVLIKNFCHEVVLYFSIYVSKFLFIKTFVRRLCCTFLYVSKFL